MRRPCSSHVYQVTDTPARRATSSRAAPACAGCGLAAARPARATAPRAWRAGTPPAQHAWRRRPRPQVEHRPPVRPAQGIGAGATRLAAQRARRVRLRHGDARHDRQHDPRAAGRHRTRCRRSRRSEIVSNVHSARLLPGASIVTRSCDPARNACATGSSSTRTAVHSSGGSGAASSSRYVWTGRSSVLADSSSARMLARSQPLWT